MEIVFLSKAQAQLEEWKLSGNKKVLEKISAVLTSILETPETGIGKPERLKHSMSGKWSRRITQEDRVIYEIADDKIFIYSLKGHYGL